MAFPTTGVLDNFNRANGAQGPNWTRITGGATFSVMNVLSNQAVDPGAPGTFAWNYWNVATFGPDIECYLTVAVVPTDALRVGARITNAGTVNHSGYYVHFAGSATNLWDIRRIDNGGAPVTLAGTVLQAISAGDKVGISIFGAIIYAWWFKASTSTWSIVLQYDTSGDATKYSAAGRVGCEFRSATIDDFGGGTLVPGAAPSNTSLPVITGTATVGSSLACSTGSWTGDLTFGFGYQWKRDIHGSGGYSDIVGAVGSSYTLVDADDACHVICVVTASGTGGNAAANASPAGPVHEPPPSSSTGPSITGALKVGSTLTCATGPWLHMGGYLPGFAFQWQRDAAGNNFYGDIPGATAATRVLAAADDGCHLRCLVTATNSGGSQGFYSPPVGLVTFPAPTGGTVTVTGGAAIGATLTGVTSGWAGSPTSYSLIWERADDAAFTVNVVTVRGPTVLGPVASDPYTVQTGDFGKYLRCRASATNDGGTGSTSSAALGPVGLGPPVNLSPPVIFGLPSVFSILTVVPGEWT